jgi:hypothetical protein
MSTKKQSAQNADVARIVVLNLATSSARPPEPEPPLPRPLVWALAIAVIALSGIALLAVAVLAGFTPAQVIQVVDGLLDVITRLRLGAGGH